MTFQTSLFIFRRDLRLEDNTGLIFALKNSKNVIPAFIFTPEQIDNNSFKSLHCLKFMIECLKDLQNQLSEKGAKLYFFHGQPEKIVNQCISKLHIDALIVNRDYTPYSCERDEKLEVVCKANNTAFFSFDDALLNPPEQVLKKDGKPYTVFTPFFRKACHQHVLPPVQNEGKNYFREKISFAKDASILIKILSEQGVKNTLVGGRSEALNILDRLGSFNNYENLRDIPAKDYSTHLSPYLKFTVCSPREVFLSVCRDLNRYHELIRALYWRDFFSSIAFFFPHVFQGSFHQKFDKMKWSDDQNAFQRWCEGLTGFPIVDAGMREMNETGFMHNRVRMIVGSFLVKDLHIDWRWGEKYFAKTLVDYDPAVNNGNWQWVASTGCDAQPYFRIFNPWAQQKKFDPECLYIKKWIPELRDLPSKAIHEWQNEQTFAIDYPVPMVDHKEAAKEALLAYKAIRC